MCMLLFCPVCDLKSFMCLVVSLFTQLEKSHSLLCKFLLPWAWAQDNSFLSALWLSVSWSSLPCHHHKFLNMHCSQLIGVVYSFKTRWSKKSANHWLSRAPSTISPPSLSVAGRGSRCASQYFKKTWKTRRYLHIKGQHLTRPCLPAWAYSKCSAVGGGGSTVGGRGGKSECPSVEAHRGFTAARQSHEER